jgi:hypothetical protein
MFRRQRSSTESASSPVMKLNGVALFVILILIAITAIALALTQGMIAEPYDKFWPVLIAVPALLWLIAAIIRRNMRNMMISAILFGFSLSLLFALQGIPLGSTLIGIVLICVGITILLRGLLLRSLPIT